MAIIIKLSQTAQKTYLGELIVDGESIMKVRAPRPGCAARDLLNYMAVNFNMPKDAEIEVREWN